jgi:hypothetical protein
LSELPVIRISGKIPLSAQNAIRNCLINFEEFCRFNNYVLTQEISVSIYGSENADLYVSKKFIKLLESQKFHFSLWFDKQPLLTDNGFEDYVGTCFYMINCLQEYADIVEDELGRFDYFKSYQHHFDVADKNLVAEYFKILAQKLGIYHNFKAPSQLLLSHDVDIVKVKKNNLKFLLKTGKITQAALTFFTKSDIDYLKEIIDFESENHIKAIYFWLPVKGESVLKGINNADYDIYSEDIQEVIAQINDNRFLENGLHKSISTKSLDEESAMISNEKITKNRFHYLRFNVKNDWELIDQSGITDDYSLGFSHSIGFRNSYGLPFSPYSPVLQKQFNFRVHPLHIMDSTLIYYTKGDFAEKEALVMNFLNQNKENCQLGMLWHNNYLCSINFSEYRNLFEKTAKFSG